MSTLLDEGRVDCFCLSLEKRYTGIPRFTSLIRFSATARKAKTRKTKINFPFLPEQRRREQRSVCERKELV
jgi:hypothetical protein